MTKDERFMRAALAQAKKAYTKDETPIGCVIVYEDKDVYKRQPGS